MRLSLSLLLLGFAAARAAALSPLLSNRVVHERRAAPPHGWSPVRRADADARIPLSIALAQSNTDKLEQYLLDVSDPASPNYGRHWSYERIAATFRPSKETIGTVHAWLASEGVVPPRVRLSKDLGYLDVNVTVAEAEALLATEYYVFEREDGATHVACKDKYHLPEHVAKHVDLVSPTIHFAGVEPRSDARVRRSEPPEGGPSVKGRPTPSRVVLGTGDVSNCDTATTLDCLRALYNFDYKLRVPDKHSIGIVEFGRETLHLSDLDVFFQAYDPNQVGNEPALVSIDGGVLDQSITDESLVTESNLDVQYAMGLLGRDADVLLYQVTNDGGPSFPYLQYDLLLNAFDASYCTFEGGNPPQLSKYNNHQDCGTKPRADVISISYYQAEGSFGSFYAQRQCTEYGKLSLAGMTFLICSGDNGVAANGGYCLDDRGVPSFRGPNFNPIIGVTCPYVTAVGATEVQPGHSVADPERAVTSFGSGGGFSNVFARPAFQDAQVRAYVAAHTAGLGPRAFNRSSRAYPDISANGHNYQVAINGEFFNVDGTSASTPTIASMFSAVNDARIAAGKSAIGWANPALYSRAFAGVYHDVTIGGNPGCGPRGDVGFAAAPGWDPVTGLGTPDFAKMLQAWMALP